MNKKYYVIFFAGVFTAVFFTGILSLYILHSLPSWKASWLLTRLRLLPTAESSSLGQAQITYSAPKTWNPSLSGSAPSSYIVQRFIRPSPSSSSLNSYIREISELASTSDSSVKRGEHLENELAKVKKFDPHKKASYIGSLVGYNQTEANSGSYSCKEKEVYIEGRFGIPFKVLASSKESEFKGVFIGIHGRGGSPEGVLGLHMDYSNSFGSYWANEGYHVYAPLVQSAGGNDFPRLGLSSSGADVALLMDLIHFLRKLYGEGIPIVVGGISYGAKLAEIIGVINPEVSGVISIGGASRYSYSHSHLSLPSQQRSHYLNSLLDNGGVYDLIFPKSLVISVGTRDAGGWGEDGENKIYVIENFKKRNPDSSWYRVNLFYGEHESDPRNEAISYKQLKSNDTFQLPHSLKLPCG